MSEYQTPTCRTATVPGYTFPRTHRGQTDTGRIVETSPGTCPNCRSKKYFETASLEYCPSCTLKVDYWAEGGKIHNGIYLAMEERKRKQRLIQERRAERQREKDAREDELFMKKL